jgi:hypothetical protein
MFKTIDEIKAANEALGHHWFSPSTLRFFRSRVLSTVYGGRFFVTSEKRTGWREPDQPRLYTIRKASDDGSIETVGEFQEYRTARQAKAAIRYLLGRG